MEITNLHLNFSIFLSESKLPVQGSICFSMKLDFLNREKEKQQ